MGARRPARARTLLPAVHSWGPRHGGVGGGWRGRGRVHAGHVGGPRAGGDDYIGVRAVNFCRRQVAAGVAVDAILAVIRDASAPIWDDDTLLAPVIESDPLLYSLGFADDSPTASGVEGEEAAGADPSLVVVGRGIAK